MKMLCFADMHINSVSDNTVLFHQWKAIINEENPDIVLVAGDVFDNPLVEPYEYLGKLGDLPVVFCLGNHEFFQHRNILDTLEYYSSRRRFGHSVYCLDVDGFFEFGGVLFVGNVLWYDGSMSNLSGQGDIISPRWLDSSIDGFRWREENRRCEMQIKAHSRRESSSTVLLTHCVPHTALNEHYVRRVSEFNMYSGVSDLFKKLSFYPDVSICGHTHIGVEKDINGVRCYNIGNDYFIYGRTIVYKTVMI